MHRGLCKEILGPNRTHFGTYFVKNVESITGWWYVIEVSRTRTGRRGWVWRSHGHGRFVMGEREDRLWTRTNHRVLKEITSNVPRILTWYITAFMYYLLCIFVCICVFVCMWGSSIHVFCTLSHAYTWESCNSHLTVYRRVLRTFLLRLSWQAKPSQQPSSWW